MSISPEDFAYVTRLVHDQAGLVIDRGKEYLVESRLGALAERVGETSVKDLLARVRTEGCGELCRKVVESLTINETLFFRDLEPFHALRQQILPELIQKRSAEQRITIWSAAAATGQEIYSVGMVLLEHFPILRNWNVSLLATDISRESLDRARAGVYSQFEVNRGLPASYLVKYFDQVGTSWRVKPIPRKMVHFEELNLSKPFPGITGVDVVLMRNVLIYFDSAGRTAILDRVIRTMKKDGFLMLGTAESLGELATGLVRHSFGRCSFYRQQAGSTASIGLV